MKRLENSSDILRDASTHIFLNSNFLCMQAMLNETISSFIPAKRYEEISDYCVAVGLYDALGCTAYFMVYFCLIRIWLTLSLIGAWTLNLSAIFPNRSSFR